MPLEGWATLFPTSGIWRESDPGSGLSQDSIAFGA